MQTRGVNLGITLIVHLYNTNKGVNNCFTSFNTYWSKRVVQVQCSACAPGHWTLCGLYSWIMDWSGYLF